MDQIYQENCRFVYRENVSSTRSSGKGLVAPVSPRKLRAVQEDASTDTIINRNLARDAKGIELEQGAEKAKQQLAMYQQQLKWATESLEGHNEIHKKSVSAIIRKLLGWSLSGRRAEEIDEKIYCARVYF